LASLSSVLDTTLAQPANRPAGELHFDQPCVSGSGSSVGHSAGIG
jgi:hypothetical protein